MDFLRLLRRLWRHGLFRKLVGVRVAAQAADGILQVGTAAYVLFSPQEQPDAWSIAAVLAISLLPFSVLGPFISIVLDRWNRRQIIIVTDLIRIGIALALAAMVATGSRDPLLMGVFMVLVLVAMSLNRFLLAGLQAALPHTVDHDEYLDASTVMPMIGPAGVVLGAGVAGGMRLSTAGVIEAHQADALIFCIAALCFAVTVAVAYRIPPDALGPHHTDRVALERPGDVLRGLGAALSHLRERRPAGLGLLVIGAQRIVYGMVTVSAILLYRNWFHEVSEVDAAIADLGIWMGATGAGFILSAFITPPGTRRLGLRGWIIAVLFGGAVLQWLPGSVITPPTLVVAAFGLGLASQSLKICVDALVQAHVDDDFKGRVFTLYDMVFNTSLVAAAVLTAALFPANGHTVVGFVVLGGLFALVGVAFTLASARLDPAVWRAGTEAESAPAPAGGQHG